MLVHTETIFLILSWCQSKTSHSGFAIVPREDAERERGQHAAVVGACSDAGEIR